VSLWEIFLFWVSVYFGVLLLGFQSRNINTGRYAWAAVTSIAIGVMQVISVRAIVALPTTYVLMVSCTAGPLGITSAMWFSHHVIEKRGVVFRK
jgi:hypothetical protein